MSGQEGVSRTVIEQVSSEAVGRKPKKKRIPRGMLSMSAVIKRLGQWLDDETNRAHACCLYSEGRKPQVIADMLGLGVTTAKKYLCQDPDKYKSREYIRKGTRKRKMTKEVMAKVGETFESLKVTSGGEPSAKQVYKILLERQPEMVNFSLTALARAMADERWIKVNGRKKPKKKSTSTESECSMME